MNALAWFSLGVFVGEVLMIVAWKLGRAAGRRAYRKANR